MSFPARFILCTLIVTASGALWPVSVPARDEAPDSTQSAVTAPAEWAQVTITDGTKIQGEAAISGDTLLLKSPAISKRLKLSEIASIVYIPQPAREMAGSVIPKNTGLRAEYFDDQDLKKLKLVRYDPAVNFQWGLGSPDTSVAIDFSARWTGKILADFSETYTFVTFAEDGVRLWIDNKLLIDQWNDIPPFKQSCKIELEQGKKYDLRLEYRNKSGEAAMRLRWQSKSVPMQAVSALNLFPPDVPTTLNSPADSAKPATATTTAATQQIGYTVALISPQPDRWKISPGTIDLEAATTFPDAEIARVEFYTGKTLLGMKSSAPFKHTWANVPRGQLQLSARLIDKNGTIHASPDVSVNIAANGSGSLPPPWGSMRLGLTERRDSCAYSGGLYTIRAGGGELRGAYDSGYFIAQPLDEDGQITIRVGNLSGDTTPHAACGVMFRESLAGDARYVAVIAGKETVEYLSRREPASWVSASELTRSTPCYLRLVRLGNLFKAYVSESGSSWQLVGSDQVNFLSTAYVGIISTSRADDELCSISVDHVNMQAGSPPMDAASAGVRLTNGTFIAGDIPNASADKVEWQLNDKKNTMGTGQVARIYLQPVPEEMTTNLSAGHTGILLANGDFYEGDFNGLSQGKVIVNSVVFGPKKFNVSDVMAIVLHDLPKSSPAFHVQLKNGNVYCAKTLQFAGEKIVLADEILGMVSITLPELREIKRMK